MIDNERLGFALIALAGCVDAIGFMKIGGTFISFMSGNSTRTAIDVVLVRPQEAISTLIVIALFVAGAFAGELIATRWPSRGRIVVLGSVALLLAVTPFLPGKGIVPVLPAVLAMGIQNAAVHKMGPVKASLTYVTGTLVHLGEELAHLAFGRKSTWHIYALMWLCMIAGALIGALLFFHVHANAFYLPAAAAAILAVLGENRSHENDRT